MNPLATRGFSYSLLTDLYQLTMAYGYWKSGCAAKEAVFHLYFRKAPFGGSYAVFCGLNGVRDLIDNFHFGKEELAYLATLTGNDGRTIFHADFLDYLHNLKLSCEVYSLPEGTLAFPNEPLLRIKGPIIQCQLLETALLNLVNFQTLVATKAARVVQAAEGDPVLEFGLRRAQGIDGGLSASRAAYVGGCAGTSNVLAGKHFGIPVKGTHAHSWVMSFEDEKKAFQAYAQALPNNCVFLVDTYDTLNGIQKAVEVGRELRKNGHVLLGIRLDSGDMAEQSIAARKLLDEAGFEDAVIVASNDLDETTIRELKDKGARIGMWGVGTKLATAFPQAALGGVYKLSAIRDPGQPWIYKIKLSAESVKTSNPGIQQVKRFYERGRMRGDIIYDEGLGFSGPGRAFFPAHEPGPLEGRLESEDLLVPLFRNRNLSPPEDLEQVRQRVSRQLRALPERFRRLRTPAIYPVGLDRQLHDFKLRLMAELSTDPPETKN